MIFVFQRVDLPAVFIWITALLILSVSIAAAAESSSLGQVVIPNPATPVNEQQCVEPTEVMRRDHMKYLMHQRDETVLNGIRTKKYSLTGCINCHAQADKNGEIVRSDDPSYFCTECHNYTAVKIDCFECHSDRATEVTSKLESGSMDYSAIYSSVPANDQSHSRLHQTLLQQVEMRE